MNNSAEQLQKNSLELGAWILPIGEGVSIAIGRYELKYVEYLNSLVAVPDSPTYRDQGFEWRNRFISALDILSFTGHSCAPVTHGERMAAIIAYENSHGELEFGAIFLHGIPKLLVVNANQSVPISELDVVWQSIANAAFRDQEHLYPVLNLIGLFDNTPDGLSPPH